MAGALPAGADLQVAIADGLSAAAVRAQVPALLPMIAAEAARRGWRFGRPFFVRHGRVGVLNDIGELLDPAVVVLLIGERPGLATAESLSAYMAYRPRAGHDDARRNLISNIHARGVPPDEAAVADRPPGRADDPPGGQRRRRQGAGDGGDRLDRRLLRDSPRPRSEIRNECVPRMSGVRGPAPIVFTPRTVDEITSRCRRLPLVPTLPRGNAVFDALRRLLSGKLFRQRSKALHITAQGRAAHPGNPVQAFRSRFCDANPNGVPQGGHTGLPLGATTRDTLWNPLLQGTRDDDPYPGRLRRPWALLYNAFGV